MVRLELTRAIAHYPLKVARLPFRHIRRTVVEVFLVHFGTANIRTKRRNARMSQHFLHLFFVKKPQNTRNRPKKDYLCTVFHEMGT